ncbi:MAG: SIMPL domain-containing protein [Acidobacteria bacterium]|nr:SIMPL domain-containing protein [Acidobacteriota bacterium]
MRRHLTIWTGIFALVVLCTAQVFAREINVRGRLGRTVEAGGWLILTDAQKYLILNPQRFQNESWFREGAGVEATGETKTDVVTSYQEGIPFEARSMRPSEEGARGNDAVAGAPRRATRVIVSGDSIVQAQPDTAIINISVITQNKSALNAQQENANRSDQVVRAVKAAAGAGAEVKTSGYNLQPITVYKEGQPPTITGYQASNSVTVTMSDLTKVGAVIDAASQAGANNINGVSFTLRKDRPAKDQALADATRAAVGKAQTIAQALGGRVSRIIEVQEGNVTPRPIYDAEYGRNRMMAQSAAAPTPIEVGTLDITSQVQLIAEIETGQ